MIFDPIRLICAFLVGLNLCWSGTLIQATTRNEMAGPSTIGMNAWVVIMIMGSYILNAFYSFSFAVEHLSFFLFMLITFSIIIFFNSKNTKKVKKYGNAIDELGPFLILGGLCFNLFVGAVFSFLQFFFFSYNYEFPTQLWFGNFRYISPGSPLILCIVTLVIFIGIHNILKGLRLLSFGASLALNLGEDPKKIQKKAIILALLATAVSTCYFGVLPFLGLIFPHLLRSFQFFRKNLRYELLYGAAICGVGLAILDWLCLNFPHMGIEFPVGLISAFLGTILLLILVVHRFKLQNETY